MDRRIITNVVRRALPQAVPATLSGYRKWDSTLGYPLILPDSASSCAGVVFFSLTAADWEKLDAYECTDQQPPAYFRRLISVEGAHGRINAYTYVGNLNFFRTRIKR